MTARPAVCDVCGGRHRPNAGWGARHMRVAALVEALRRSRGRRVYLRSRYLVRALRARGVLLEALPNREGRPFWVCRASELARVARELPPSARREAARAVAASAAVAAGQSPRAAGLRPAR